MLPVSESLLAHTHFDANPTKPAGHAFPAHINSEMRRRCDDVERLIHRLGFPSDASLANDITSGKIPTHLTTTDVHLNRLLRGPCPHQLAGKARDPVAPTSTTAPATSIGENVSFDIAILLDPPLGGRTHEIFFYDELSGFCGHELAASKRHDDILSAILAFRARVFTAHGHILRHLHGDDEVINSSLELPLANQGITLSLSLPGQHARFVERCIETVRSRSRSMLSPLPYWLPLIYTPHLHKAAIHVMNHSINTRSAPSTPSEIIHGTKITTKTIPLQFGSCHLVTQLDGKRSRLASKFQSQFRYVPKTEIAVCLGPDPLTNSHLFLTESGQIGPKVVRQSMPPSYVPFDWVPKTFTPIISIPKHATLPDTHRMPLPIPTRNTFANLSTDDTDSVGDNDAADDYDVVITAPAPMPTAASAPTPPTTPEPSPLPVPQSPAETTPTTSTRGTRWSTRATNQPARFRITPAAPTPTPAVQTPPTAAAQTPTTTTPTSTHGTRWSVRATNQLVRLRNTPTAFLTTPRPQTTTRKLDNHRKATARNAVYRQSLDINHLHDRPSTHQPNPPPPETRHEVNCKRAVALWGRDKVDEAEQKELKKILVTYKSFIPINKSDINPHAVYLRSMALYKQKSDNTISCRIPIDGSSQPPGSFGDTAACTTDLTDRLFILSLVLKDAADRGCLEQVDLMDGDLPAAFINGNSLSQGDTGNTMFITQLPKDLLDQSKAGITHEVIGAHYGTKQANHIYDVNLDLNMLTTGKYTSSPLHPRIYIRRNPDDPNKYSLVVFYVDDFEHFGTCPILKAEFKTMITNRYGPDVKFRDPGVGTTGLEYTRNPNHSITVTVTKYIHKLLHKAGMELVDPALTPSLPNFFRIDPDSPLLDSPTTDHFRTINGIMIWALPVRIDICKEVRWLCTRNNAPTLEDRNKQIHLLRYLKGVPDIGPTFSGHSADSPGIRIVAASDVGHAVHHNTGASQIAFQLAIGETNAPFKTSCYAEKGIISPDPTTAEYIGLSDCAKQVLYRRQDIETLGFHQTGPSIIRQDNNSAINLAVAPQVTNKSRFINIRHHLIRSAIKEKLIQPVYTNTNALGFVDMHTKSPSISNTNQFLYNRSILLNDRAKATPNINKEEISKM